jgi:hypothetical protein
MTGIKNRAISMLLAFVFILSAFAVPAAAAEPLNASELYLSDDGTELAEGIEYTGDERTDPAIEGYSNLIYHRPCGIMQALNRGDIQ